MDILIRKENEEDIPIVYDVIEESFRGQDFSNQEEVNLVKNLRNSKYFVKNLSLIAEYDGEIVAYILFSIMKFKLRDNHIENILILAPVSVVPKMQNKGIGSKLIKEGHRIAKSLGFKGVIVVGHPDYYPKFGYKSISNFDIICNMDLVDDITMLYEIEKDYFKNNSGEIIFSDIFLH